MTTVAAAIVENAPTVNHVLIGNAKLGRAFPTASVNNAGAAVVLKLQERVGHALTARRAMMLPANANALGLSGASATTARPVRPDWPAMTPIFVNYLSFAKE